jgi:hypothetical protein
MKQKTDNVKKMFDGRILCPKQRMAKQKTSKEVPQKRLKTL